MRYKGAKNMEETRLSPRLFTETGDWVKFRKYEVIEIEGELYIKPVENSLMEVYDPYEKSPLILLDLIKTAENMQNHDNDRDKAKDILRFVNKYGLLGMYGLWANSFYSKFKRIEPKTFEENSKKQTVILEKMNNAKSQNELTELWSEYNQLDEDLSTDFVKLRPTNPFGKKLTQKFIPDSQFLDNDEWEYNKYASIFFPHLKPPYPKRDKDYSNFWRNYCEPVYSYIHLLLVSFKSVYMWAVDLEEFEKGNYSLEDHYGHNRHFRGLFHQKQTLKELTPTWGDILSNTVLVDNIDIRLSIDDEGAKKIEYYTFSLYDDICLIFIQDRASKNQVLKQCKNEKCNQWFIAKSPKAQYCCTSCGTSVRVLRFRKK
jgi:hypothetical protein